MKRQSLTAMAIVGVFSGVVMGDKILSRGKYEVPLIEITGFQEGLVTYLSNSRQTRYKPLRNILQLTIDRQRLLSRAEQLRLDKQYAMAAELYANVTAGDSPAWVKQVARYRTVDVAQKAGRIDLAMRAWLDIVSREPGDEALKMAPQAFAPRGDQRNVDAIESLETNLASQKNKTIRRVILKSLVAICRYEGLTEKADAYAEAIQEQVLQATAQSPSPMAHAPMAKVSPFASLFLAAGQLVRPDQKPEVLREQVEKLQANLNNYAVRDLGRAMLLIGKARMYLAQHEKDAPTRRQMFLQAGLTLMRAKVAAQKPDVAAEALYEAGRVNELIGNRRAAEAAYRAVLSRYPQVHDIVQKAKKAIQTLTEHEGKTESVSLKSHRPLLPAAKGGTIA